MSVPSLESIVEDFSFLDDWEDRYRYLIELGRTLEPLREDARSENNRVRGCVSQVWLETHVAGEGEDAVLTFDGDSDAHIVRGLVALALAIYSGKSAKQIISLDAAGIFSQLGLMAHLTPQRSNGVRAMLERIRKDARAALEPAPTS
jgi:cysteine desulfuration protein SufE